MIKTVIVDDEPLALEILQTYIEQLDDIELVASCSNALEANKVLQENEVDLLITDIQMPQITGIEFVKSLKNPPLVIFSTAFENYAVEGFELEAIDYLLKPIPMDRFMKAINRVSEIMATRKPKGEDEGFFFVKADKKLIKLAHDEILFIEGLKDYVIIKKIEGRVVSLQTMKSLEEKLPDDVFLRIHRSYIININKIHAVMGNVVEMLVDGKMKHIPVGKSYRDRLQHIIDENKL